MTRTKIYIIGDAHLGHNYKWGIDKYSVSKRSKDMLKHFENLCDNIIENNDAILIIFAGDFLDQISINHTIEQYIHKIIFVKLKTAKIGVIIIGGNHDTYADVHRGCMLDNFDYNQEQNCIVVRDFCAFNFMITNSMKRLGVNKTQKINAWWKKYIIPTLCEFEVGIVCYPFTTLEGLMDYYIKPRTKKELHKAVEKDFNFTQAQKFILKDMETEIIPFIENCKHKLIVGHFRLDGSKISEYKSASVYTHEINFTKEMVKPEVFDLVAFGHIHVAQKMWGCTNVMHLGAIDRQNWGEWNEKKSYITYDLNGKKINEISLEYDSTFPNRAHCRSMYSIDIKIPSSVKNPSEYVINKIRDHSDKYSDALVRICLTISRSSYNSSIDKEIKDNLNEITYYTEIDYNIVNTDPEREIEEKEVKVEMDRSTLLNDYLEKFVDNPNFADIRKIANELLSECIREEEIK